MPALYTTEGQSNETVLSASYSNAQNVVVLDGSAFTVLYGQGGAQISVIENSLTIDSLIPFLNSTHTQEGGASGSVINTYVVQPGDTISGIAEKFSVSQSTVVWANDLRGSTIRIGQELVILPISGVLHTVSKGDTIKGLAKKYSADMEDILSYNGFTKDEILTIGSEITVPYGTIPQPKVVVRTPSRSSSVSGATATVWTNTKTIWTNGVKTTPLRNTNGPNYDGYYIRPISGYSLSRGLHGNNGVDWAAPKGTAIMAAASGTVNIAKYSGWNGGYGQYVVINHNNGTQTLYAHMSTVNVYPGQQVVAGQVIGRIGTTGNSTGNHLHFEIHGAQNAFR